MTRFLCLSMFIFSCAGQSKVASPPLGSDNEAAVEKKSVEATPVQSLVRLAGSIEIVTIKNETAPVPLQIQSFEASLLGVESADGVFEFEDAALVLPLAAINSGLDIRDQRIRETFFHADQNPNARFEIARLILDSPTVPTSAKFEGKLVDDYEGCLSVKNVYGKVPRYSKIRVKALNLQGEEVRFRAEGFLARVIQHEIDHTNGIVFIDHIKEDENAFYTLNEKGELDPLAYDLVKDDPILWD